MDTFMDNFWIVICCAASLLLLFVYWREVKSLFRCHSKQQFLDHHLYYYLYFHWFFHFLRIVIVQIVLTNIWCPQMYCIHYLCLVPAWRSYGHYFWTWCKKGARNASFSHCVLVWSGPETKVFIFFMQSLHPIWGKKCALSANTCPLCFFSPVKKSAVRMLEDSVNLMTDGLSCTCWKSTFPYWFLSVSVFWHVKKEQCSLLHSFSCACWHFLSTCVRGICLWLPDLYSCRMKMIRVHKHYFCPGL